MQIGKMNKRVVVQTATEVRDAVGEPIRTWADTATVWAQIEPLSGRELLMGEQVTSEATVRVWLRYRTLTTANRLTEGGDTYEIQSVRNVNSHDRLLECMCKVLD